MTHKYAQIAFTDSVKKLQSELGSRQGYTSMEQGEDYNFLLSQVETDFISQRDSFYMASVSETNWPYLQHRGGPKGFLKVLDAKTLGFSDYKGNRQYISTGNFKTNDRVSLFFMDYVNRRRLKLYGKIRLVTNNDWETLAALEDDNYRAVIERAFVIDVEAFDWNCPQHITPRYSELEIESVISPLTDEIERLKKQLASSNTTTYPVRLGNGDLPLVISGIRQLTPDVKAIELRSSTGNPLPQINAGAHIEVPVQLTNGELVWRHYSISSNPNRRDVYEIAVKRADHTVNNTKYDIKSASKSIHQNFTLGLILNCRKPKNYFKLVEQPLPSVLIAGGIGITPIKSMALSLASKNRSFELHYAGRSRSDMPYQDRLIRQFSNQLHLYPSTDSKRLNLSQLIQNSVAGSHFYICGPNRMIDDFLSVARGINIPTANIHYEKFTPSVDISDESIALTLNNSHKTIAVAANESILNAVLAAGIQLPHSCLAGNCKSCVVQVIEGEIEHRDNCLSQEEKNQNLMCSCVSRAKNNQLTLAL